MGKSGVEHMGQLPYLGDGFGDSLAKKGGQYQSQLQKWSSGLQHARAQARIRPRSKRSYRHGVVPRHRHRQSMNKGRQEVAR
jgi:hypothetical protein